MLITQVLYKNQSFVFHAIIEVKPKKNVEVVMFSGPLDFIITHNRHKEFA